MKGDNHVEEEPYPLLTRSDVYDRLATALVKYAGMTFLALVAGMAYGIHFGATSPQIQNIVGGDILVGPVDLTLLQSAALAGQITCVVVILLTYREMTEGQ